MDKHTIDVGLVELVTLMYRDLETSYAKEWAEWTRLNDEPMPEGVKILWHELKDSYDWIDGFLISYWGEVYNKHDPHKDCGMGEEWEEHHETYEKVYTRLKKELTDVLDSIKGCVTEKTSEVETDEN